MPDYRNKMKLKVAQSFAELGKHPSDEDEVVDVLATVGAGYLEGAAAPFLGLPARNVPESAYGDVADDLVRRFLQGEHPMPDVRNYRSDFRYGIDGALNGLNGPWPSEVVRQTLTSLAMGSWDGADYRSLRGALPYGI